MEPEHAGQQRMERFGFTDVVVEWFRSRFDGPTEPQQRAWPAIAAGHHTLVAAPTGSGKTLTAFLACINRLVERGLRGELADELSVLYVSPLRALSNDMHQNLELPLREIEAVARERGIEFPNVRVGLRTGDTPASQRAALVRKPPHILVTTPESLYLLLTSDRGREALATTETVIVDEIHALVRDKRGSHLALSLERLEHLCAESRGLGAPPLQRIGLSATQKPIELVADFLVGADPDSPPSVVDVGHRRELDLGIEVPPSELGAICSYEQWDEIAARLVELIEQHRSTLVFVNTRRLAERVTHQLTELLGEEVVGAHHGSLSAETRHDTERRLKAGELKAVVATASLELGLDVGAIDLVVQIGSPRSIATFLQRVGRSGHALGLVPKGRLFALTRDELVECMGLVRAVRAGRLDALRIPKGPLDVLAQQIVAEASVRECGTDELFELFRRSYAYRDLSRHDFDATLEYLGEGINNHAGRSRRYLHHDRVNGRVRARKGARIVALSNGGAIAEIASFRVVAIPEGVVVGSLDEDFATESSRGDVFLLGNTSWRFEGLRGNDVLVSDAFGAPPTIPFWRGEAPGRTIELSEEVSRLRAELQRRIEAGDLSADWLVAETSCSEFAAEQIVQYAAAEIAAIGLLPTQERVVFERFFDDTGGMQLVVHAPFGGNVCRAWGYSMRKRFCRSFDFELQATADDDGFILSLGPQHSFPVESLFPMLTPANARGLLEQAVLAVPVFEVRWRWNVQRSLLVERMRNGKKVPPALQRFRADDLLTAVFPKLTGCQEEHTGDHEIPDHPLTNQTIHDALTETLDIDGLEEVLGRVQRGEIEFVARDTREPSPFCYELLNANPYAFLDGGEAAERRTRAVATRRTFDADDVRDLSALDPVAIDRVTREAQPPVRNADELHDLLLIRGVVAESAELPNAFLEQLATARRAARFLVGDRAFWVAAERLGVVVAAYGEVELQPPISPLDDDGETLPAANARVAIVRGHVETSGPVTAGEVASLLELSESQVHAALEAIEAEGVVVRGRFSPAASQPDSDRVEWCHRRLLARIHRLTITGLREQIQPVDVACFTRFLLKHHGVVGDRRTGVNGLHEVLQTLQGIDLPAECWERDVLPARLKDYEPKWLDELCLSGEVAWARLFPPPRGEDRPRRTNVSRVVPLSLFLREDAGWLQSVRRYTADPGSLEETARRLYELLRDEGALFAADMLQRLELLPYQLADVLGDLVARGFLTADGFAGIRSLTGLSERSAQVSAPRRGGFRPRRVETGVGRWSLRSPATVDDATDQRSAEVESWAWQLLRRWGVVFRDLLDREQGAPRWFELVRFYRRAEARGEVRGGRFVAGVGGEQYALPHVVAELRRHREHPEIEDELVTVCAADPLNLTGILDAGERIPATASNRLFLRNGVAVAAWQAGELRELVPMDESARRVLASVAGVKSTSPWSRTARLLLDDDENPGELPLAEHHVDADNTIQPDQPASTSRGVR